MNILKKYNGAKPSKNPTIIAVVVLLLAVFDIGFFVLRHQFAHLITAYLVAFTAYLFLILNKKENFNVNFYLKIAVLLRGVLLFAQPHLSDDVYRFIWDGQLINEGINPFNQLPQFYADNNLWTARLTPDLFQHVNSPRYFTIYPPIAQAIFAAAVWVFPKSYYGATLIIKLFLFVCEIGSLFLIKNIIEKNTKQYNLKNFLIYAFNPLIIIELCTNVHLESALIFFFFLSIYFLQHNKILHAALAIALAIAVKLIPILFVLPLLKRMRIGEFLKYFITLGIALILLFLPLFNAVFIENMSKSLNLYFQKFEFNASLYYLVSRPIEWIKGYNPIQQIAPMLSFLTAMSLLFVALLEKTKATLQDFALESYFEKCLFIMSIYLLTATTVHPWYATIPLALSIFTKWQYPIVWTFTIIFTYTGYTEGSSKHTENYYWLFVEYGVVFYVFFQEFFKNKRLINLE